MRWSSVSFIAAGTQGGEEERSCVLLRKKLELRSGEPARPGRRGRQASRVRTGRSAATKPWTTTISPARRTVRSIVS